MKVLELGNVMLPQIAKDLNAETPCFGGWLAGALGALNRERDVAVYYVFPYDKICRGTADGIVYYSFVRPSVLDVNRECIAYFKALLTEIEPDVIHIWGTEFSHSLCMVKAARELGRADSVVVSIQGLCNEYAEVYEAGLPKKILTKRTLRDILRKDDILKQKQLFFRRGENEIAVLQNVKHVIGRTRWDKECCLKRNPKLNYHFCNETLREEFYTFEKWSAQTMDRHTIFCSQASYPIKGFHILLQALPKILAEYPDTTVSVTGGSFLSGGFFARQKRNYYWNYLRRLVKTNGAEKNIVFLGSLDAAHMAEQYAKCNVFVSPSAIENSSNSVCEAQLLGVPVVASNVGGTDTIVTHESDGLLYEFSDSSALAQFVLRVFENDAFASELGANAARTAACRHNAMKNNGRLMEIYRTVSIECSDVHAKERKITQ